MSHEKASQGQKHIRGKYGLKNKCKTSWLLFLQMNCKWHSRAVFLEQRKIMTTRDYKLFLATMRGHSLRGISAPPSRDQACMDDSRGSHVNRSYLFSILSSSFFFKGTEFKKKRKSPQVRETKPGISREGWGLHAKW